MNVNDVLKVVGRLDDSSGFDTPCERFRRFLNGRLTDAQAARAVVEECQQIAGEQNRRALQDALVLAGRCLGFRTSFGRYQHVPGTAPISGEWDLRRRLHVLVSVWTGHTADTELDALAQAVRRRRQEHENGSTACVALCIMTRFFPGRARVEKLVGAFPELRLISVDGFLDLIDLVAAQQLSSDDVLQVLNPDVTLDAVVHLLGGSRAPRAGEACETVPPVAADVASSKLTHWMVAIRLDPATPTCQFIESMIARRQILPTNPGFNVHRPIEPGDSICVCVIGMGVVADARVSGLIPDAGSVVRHSERFAQVLRVADVTVYDSPVPLAPELTHRLELSLIDDAMNVATPLTENEFELVTRRAAAPARS